MSLPGTTLKLVEAKLSAFCSRRVPTHLRDQVRLHHKVRGDSVTLLEGRPAFGLPLQWVDIPVAQFRYDTSSHK
jgi:hypothetical protein